MSDWLEELDHLQSQCETSESCAKCKLNKCIKSTGEVQANEEKTHI